MIPLDDRQKRYARQASAVTLFLVVGAGVYLAIMSGVVRYYDNIKVHPWRFALELILLCLGIAVPYIVIFKLRGGRMTRLWIDVPLLLIKFVAGWILFELSGVNNVVFPVPHSNTPRVF